MKPTPIIHVIIDNLPSGDTWYHQWIPIIIALFSLTVTVVSIFYTRRTFILNTRPYISAANYANMKDNQFFHRPDRLMFVLKGFPAKVDYRIDILLDKKILLTHSEKNSIQFPDGSEWSFGFATSSWNSLMEMSDTEKEKLIRIISIDYSGLRSKKRYKTKIFQQYIQLENNWKTSSIQAD